MSENEKTKRYYLKRNINWHGPFSVEQIRVFIRNGKFTEQNFISKDKKNTKYKLGSVAGFKKEFKTRNEAEPSNEDRKFNLEKNGELQGPFTADQIRTTILRGETKESDWISRVGSPNKYRIGSVGVFRKCFKTRNEAEAVRKAEVASFWCGETKDFPNSAKSKLAPTEKDPTPKENEQGPKGYYVEYVSGHEKGPLSFDQVVSGILEGNFGTEALLWTKASGVKVKLSEVHQFQHYFAARLSGTSKPNDSYESAPRPTTLFNASVGGVVAVVALFCVIGFLFGGGGGKPKPSPSPVDRYNSSIPAGMSREQSNYIGNTALENGRSIEDATHMRDAIHKYNQAQGR